MQYSELKGCKITITCQGKTYKGTILTAHKYDNAWYIEFEHDNGDYGYWKQDMDGGTIEFEG